MTGIFFGKVDLLTGAHWTMPFYLSDLFCHTTRGVCVCLSALLSVSLSMHLQASLYVCYSPCVCLSIYVCVCVLAGANATHSLDEL